MIAIFSAHSARDGVKVGNKRGTQEETRSYACNICQNSSLDPRIHVILACIVVRVFRTLLHRIRQQSGHILTTSRLGSMHFVHFHK